MRWAVEIASSVLRHHGSAERAHPGHAPPLLWIVVHPAADMSMFSLLPLHTQPLARFLWPAMMRRLAGAGAMPGAATTISRRLFKMLNDQGNREFEASLLCVSGLIGHVRAA